MVENDDPFAEAPEAPVEEAAPTPAPTEHLVVENEVAQVPDEPEAEQAPAESDAEEAEMVENDDVDVFGGMVPMVHPDGGVCDLFKEVDGKIMVPADQVETMASHGFVVDA